VRPAPASAARASTATPPPRRRPAPRRRRGEMRSSRSRRSSCTLLIIDREIPLGQLRARTTAGAERLPLLARALRLRVLLRGALRRLACGLDLAGSAAGLLELLRTSSRALGLVGLALCA